MKKRILFSACALAACFAACTNDDFQAEQNKNAVVNEAGEVIGADLASAGMTISSFGEKAPATRASWGESGPQWDIDDKTGLAWFQYGPNPQGETQNKDEWYNKQSSEMDENCSIFQNHRFYYKGGTKGWETYTDVYVGSYFAYWPFADLGAIIPKKISVNQEIPQTSEFRNEYLNKALRMSGQDFIDKSDVDEESVLQKQFYLFPMVNVIGVVATPDANINNDYLKGMEISKMTINVGGNDKAVFVDGGTIVPRVLPKAVTYNTLTGTYEQRSEDEMRKEMEKVAANATATGGTNLLYQPTTASNKLYTNIEAGFNLTKANTLRAFAFPIQEGVKYEYDNQAPSIDITVKSTTPGANWILGTFHVTNGTKGSTVIANLRDMLDEEKEGETNSWIKNIMGDDAWRIASSADKMTAMLNVNDFTPATTWNNGNTIDSQEEWEDMVALVNALKLAGKENFTEVEFQLGTDVRLKDQILTPDDVKIILNTNGNSLIVDGTKQAVAWPDNLETDKEDEITVEGTLNIGMDDDADDTNDPKVTVKASITNLGTINAGGNTVISNNPEYALDNSAEGAKVVIRYGALVYPTEDKDGVIAYRVADVTPATIGKINTLIETENNSGRNDYYAHVNTLIVALEEGEVLDLNAAATPTDGDNYNQSDERQLRSLEDIDIELEGGAIAYTVKGSKYNNTKVNNVTAVSGNNNTTTDVDIEGNILVKANATLNVQSDKDPKWKLALQDITTEKNGLLNVYTDMSVADIQNSGKIYVENSVIVYAGTFDKYSNYECVNGRVMHVSETEEAKAVASAWQKILTTDGWDLQTLSTYDNFIAEFNKNKNSIASNPDWPITEFFNAINSWRVANSRTAITVDQMTVDVLKDYEQATQTSFGLKD